MSGPLLTGDERWTLIFPIYPPGRHYRLPRGWPFPWRMATYTAVEDALEALEVDAVNLSALEFSYEYGDTRDGRCRGEIHLRVSLPLTRFNVMVALHPCRGDRTLIEIEVRRTVDKVARHLRALAQTLTPLQIAVPS